ncbi:MAG: hypothetical protein KGJ64_01395 [Betaproteobacteria bacterium]|nr:hypothetical protein [Betaproteobacteria bacterium]
MLDQDFWRIVPSDLARDRNKLADVLEQALFRNLAPEGVVRPGLDKYLDRGAPQTDTHLLGSCLAQQQQTRLRVGKEQAHPHMPRAKAVQTLLHGIGP